MGSAGSASDEASVDATIRRVAEARAADESAAGDDDTPASESVAMSDAADAAQQERRIDALVRRVAAAKAARVTETPEDPIEATIRRVAEAKAAREAAAAGGTGAETDEPLSSDDAPDAASSSTAEAPEQPLDHVATSRPADEGDPAASDGSPKAAAAATPALPPQSSSMLSVRDEDPIEATIRRVAAAKAAQEAAAAVHDDKASPAAQASAAGTIPNAAQDEPTSTQMPQAGRIITPAAWRESLRLEPAHADENGDLGRAISELRRDLDETRQALASLTARFDALQTALGGADDAPQGPSVSDEEDWDDTPSLPRIPLGQPPRPAISRDPSPRNAIPGQGTAVPDEVVIDTRPIPKPLPALQAEPRRGLDLLPRTYRVTVEDKRRGVDLVPLHRALLGLDGVRDMSLLSYSNGVAIVSLDTVDELDPDVLCNAIGRAMSRPARVEVHNEQTMVVKLAEE